LKKTPHPVDKEQKQNTSTSKGGNIMKKVLNKAISKGGEMP